MYAYIFSSAYFREMCIDYITLTIFFGGGAGNLSHALLIGKKLNLLF